MTSGHRLTQFAHGGGCACKIPPGELEEMVRGLTGAAHPRPRRGPRRRRRRGGGAHRGRPGGAQRRPTSSRPWSTTPMTGAGSRRPTPCPTSTPWAAGPWSRSTCWAGPATCSRASWPRRCCAAGSTWPRRRAAPSPAATASTTRSRSTAWPSPASATRTGCCATTPPRLASRSASPSRSGSACSTTGTRRPARCSSTRSSRWSRLNADGLPGGPGRGHHRGHRRHRVRAAGPPVQDGPRLGRHRGGRRRRRPLPRGGARVAARRVRPRRQQAQPRLGAAAPRAPTSTRTSCILLADAQTSGGLLVAGEIPGAPVVGEFVPARGHALHVR